MFTEITTAQPFQGTHHSLYGVRYFLGNPQSYAYHDNQAYQQLNNHITDGSFRISVIFGIERLSAGIFQFCQFIDMRADSIQKFGTFFVIQSSASLGIAFFTHRYDIRKILFCLFPASFIGIQFLFHFRRFARCLFILADTIFDEFNAVLEFFLQVLHTIGVILYRGHDNHHGLRITRTVPHVTQISQGFYY